MHAGDKEDISHFQTTEDSFEVRQAEVRTEGNNQSGISQIVRTYQCYHDFKATVTRHNARPYN